MLRTLLPATLAALLTFLLVSADAVVADPDPDPPMCEEVPEPPKEDAGGTTETKETKETEPPKETEDEKARKALEKQAKQTARGFKIERFAFASNQTSEGVFPEVRLQFRNTVKPKYITLIFYAWTKKGKLLYNAQSFFGPDVKVKHVMVAGYHAKWVRKYGRLAAGRVELYLGTKAKRALMHTASCGKGAPKEWWKGKPEEDYLMRYRPKSHPAESNTVKKYGK